jgi:drug/metabolite transporter (DMT)-like permease
LPATAEKKTGILLAVGAVILFASSPVLVLWARPLSPFEITAGRLGSAALAVAVLARLSGQPVLPARRDIARFLIYGLITAIHFCAYIASLNYTTIAHSLAIVYTAPVFVTLLSALLLHEPIARRKWFGVLITVGGIALLAGMEPRMTPQMAFGDGLALVSAVAFGFYSVAGRGQRHEYGLLTYAGTVYGAAALWMLPLAAANFTPAGYRLAPLAAMLAAGLVPLGVGHTLYNAALRRIHATTANLIATQEVTGGIILGALLVGQIPSLTEVTGAVIALVGIFVVLI